MGYSVDRRGTQNPVGMIWHSCILSEIFWSVKRYSGKNILMLPLTPLDGQYFIVCTHNYCKGFKNDICTDSRMGYVVDPQGRG